MAQDNVKAVIEALLFSSDRPLLLEQMKHVLGLDTNQIRLILEELRLEYENSCRGMRVIEVAGGFQMTTAADFAPFLKKLYKERRAERLSKPALETLAIIAYKQPVTRLEIESLRSVNIDGVMRSLVEKNLIRISGRKKAPGRPHVFGTTRQFMEHFGLKTLEDLPKMEEFRRIAEEKTGEELSGPDDKDKAEAINEPSVSA